MRADHVTMRGPGLFCCERCGQRYELNLPAPIDLWLAAAQAWLAQHRSCT